MTKRITALFIAVIIPITLIFTGCGNKNGKQPTIDEYRNTLKSVFSEYSDAIGDVPLKTENDTVEKMKPYWEDARESCRRCNEALDKFEEIKPPQGFAEKHKKLLEGVDNEKKYVAVMESFLTAQNEDDLKKYSEEMGKFTSLPIDQTLAGIFSELYKEVSETAGFNTEASQL